MGGLSVSIVSSQTQATEFSFFKSSIFPLIHEEREDLKDYRLKCAVQLSIDCIGEGGQASASTACSCHIYTFLHSTRLLLRVIPRNIK
jgi:hypothetical protein